MEFLRRFVQHVLPTGFMKVRYYGFMSPGSNVSMDKVAACIERCAALVIHRIKVIIAQPKPPRCSYCGGQLVFYASIVPLRLPAHATG